MMSGRLVVAQLQLGLAQGRVRGSVGAVQRDGLLIGADRPVELQLFDVDMPEKPVESRVVRRQLQPAGSVSSTFSTNVRGQGVRPKPDSPPVPAPKPRLTLSPARPAMNHRLAMIRNSTC